MNYFNRIKWVATTLDGKTIELPDNETLLLLVNSQADSLVKIERVLEREALLLWEKQ